MSSNPHAKTMNDILMTLWGLPEAIPFQSPPDQTLYPDGPTRSLRDVGQRLDKKDIAGLPEFAQDIRDVFKDLKK